MMRAIALTLLLACAHAPCPTAHDLSADFVCRPPQTIAGHEPSLCWYRGEGEMWCVYGVDDCDGTWVRQDCDGEWALAWSECHLPSLRMSMEQET